MDRLTQSLLIFFSPAPLQGFFIPEQIHLAKEELLDNGLSKWNQPSLLSCKAALVDSEGKAKKDLAQYCSYADELQYRLAIENWYRVEGHPTEYGVEELYKNLRSIFNKSSLTSEDLIKAMYPCFQKQMDSIRDEDTNTSCNQAFADLVRRSLNE